VNTEINGHLQDITIDIVALGGLVVVVLAIGPKVHRFKTS
jgi:hypothetical protein